MLRNINVCKSKMVTRICCSLYRWRESLFWRKWPNLKFESSLTFTIINLANLTVKRPTVTVKGMLHMSEGKWSRCAMLVLHEEELQRLYNEEKTLPRSVDTCRCHTFEQWRGRCHAFNGWWAREGSDLQGMWEKVSDAPLLAQGGPTSRVERGRDPIGLYGT